MKELEWEDMPLLEGHWSIASTLGRGGQGFWKIVVAGLEGKVSEISLSRDSFGFKTKHGKGGISRPESWPITAISVKGLSGFWHVTLNLHIPGVMASWRRLRRRQTQKQIRSDQTWCEIR